MASISITIPDTQLDRIVEAFADYYGYQTTTPDPETGDPVPNLQTKAQFMRTKVIEYIRDTVRSQEKSAAAVAAQASVADVDGIE